MVSVLWQPSSYTTFLNFHEVQMFLKFGSHKTFLILIFPPSFAEEHQRRIGKYSQQFSSHAALEWLLSGCVYPFPVPSACAFHGSALWMSTVSPLLALFHINFSLLFPSFFFYHSNVCFVQPCPSFPIITGVLFPDPWSASPGSNGMRW